MNINIPGLHNSDQAHWQSHLERNFPNQFYRINQDDWDHPKCSTWINRVEEELQRFSTEECVLIGHSIGCMTIVHWFETYKHPIKGAIFVAPTDAEKEGFPEYISGFAPIPKNKLPFPSVVIASDDDHVTKLERAKEFAQQWGSELIVLKNAGHIETKSGFGEWKLIEEVIERLSN